MSFILADPNTLALDLWPGGRGRMLRDTTSLTALPERKRVPLQYDDLSEWMSVDPCGVDADCAAWIHPDVVGGEERMEVAVRLHGIVEYANLGVLGNWNGTAMGAPKATQQITLVGGGCSAAFDPQLVSMDNVKERVLSTLGRTRASNDGPMTKLSLRRRVFQKVGGDNQKPSLGVPVSEDPLRRARKIEHLWAVTHRIVAGVQQTDGRVIRAHPGVIRVGDFVDVSVSVQVVSFRLPRGRRGVDVLFVPHTVVRLCNAQEAEIMTRSISTEDDLTDLDEGPASSTRDDGIEFEGDDHAMAA